MLAIGFIVQIEDQHCFLRSSESERFRFYHCLLGILKKARLKKSDGGFYFASISFIWFSQHLYHYFEHIKVGAVTSIDSAFSVLRHFTGSK